ncbi:MAG: VOC family protein [Nitrospirota bacterium]|nr:VOC family protein [Nitrospirota bacterium]
MGFRVNEIDHLVLTVTDIEATHRFYSRALGMKLITFGDNRTALVFGRRKINLHEMGSSFSPHANTPTPGSGDMCLLTPSSIDEVVAHLNEMGIPIEAGPVTRAGATGPIRSVYVRDPDGNLVEIGHPE